MVERVHDCATLQVLSSDCKGLTSRPKLGWLEDSIMRELDFSRHVLDLEHAVLSVRCRKGRQCMEAVGM